MHIPIIDVKFLEGLTMEVTFLDGKVVKYDMEPVIAKHPKFEALRDRMLFESGRGMGTFGVVWNDDLDWDAEDIYEDGEFIRCMQTDLNREIGSQILLYREKQGLTQKQLSKITGIDQGDISKLENGEGNPTLNKISKILNALNAYAEIKLVKKEKDD